MKLIAEQNKVYGEDERGNVIAEATFREIDSGLYDIDHVYVEKSARGNGLAADLVKETVERIERKGGCVTSSCSYGAKWLSEREEGTYKK